MVFMSNMIFDFDLFDLMRYVDGIQLMFGRSVTQPYFPRKNSRARRSIVGPACEAYTQPTELSRPVSDINRMLFGLGLYMKGM